MMIGRNSKRTNSHRPTVSAIASGQRAWLIGFGMLRTAPSRSAGVWRKTRGQSRSVAARSGEKGTVRSIEATRPGSLHEWEQGETKMQPGATKMHVVAANPLRRRIRLIRQIHSL